MQRVRIVRIRGRHAKECNISVANVLTMVSMINWYTHVQYNGSIASDTTHKHQQSFEVWTDARHDHQLASRHHTNHNELYRVQANIGPLGSRSA